MRTLAKTMVRLAATTVATGAILGAFAPDALAEGSFSSSVKQVQPQFDSRTWKDRNQDTARTKITLSNCKVNAGGKTPGSTPLQSVEVALAKGSTVVKVIKKACAELELPHLAAPAEAMEYLLDLARSGIVELSPAHIGLLAEAINRLPEREKVVLTLYYYEGLTLAQIGEVIGVTESRICQIHTKAILQLRSRMQASERESA